jgi:beta-lactamase regulating signal transducer with metallopeptidase domain
MTTSLMLVVKATVILVAALGVDNLLRRRNVLLCTAMWNAVLLALLVLPIAALALPAVPVPILRSTPTTTAAPAERAVPEELQGTSLQVDQLVTNAANAGPVREMASAFSLDRMRSRFTVGIAIAVVYAAGVMIGLIRLAAALAATARLRVTGMVVACADWQERLTKWQARLRCSVVELRQSTHVQVPLVIGCFRPAILLPQRMVAELKTRSRDAVIVHELAHVLRSDFGWQLVLRILQAVLWFHPLIWLAERRIHFVRERACDDFTIHALGSNREYANTLLAIASRLVGRPTFGLGLAVTRTPQIAARIEAIATSHGNPSCLLSARGRLAAFCACLLLAGVLGSVAIVRAQQPVGKSLTKLPQPRASPAPADQQPAKDNRPGDKTTLVRRMRVSVLTPDDEPLAGAKVFANVTLVDPVRINNREYTCDAAGQAILELPAEPIDMLRLWADSEDRVGWHAHWWRKYQPDGHLIPDEYSFRLEKGTVIGGLIRNEAGEPVVGAKVEAMRNEPLASDFKVRTFRGLYLAEIDSRHDTRRTTDADGRWTLNNVPAGDDVEVLLKVSHPEYVGDQEWGELQKRQGVTTKSLRERTGTIVMRRAAKAAVLQPPATEALAAVASAGEAKRAAGVGILGADDQPQESVGGAGVVTGDVVLVDAGTPVAGATVLLRAGRLQKATTDEMGRFRFSDIPQGHYQIWAFKEPLASPKRQLVGEESAPNANPRFSAVRLLISPGKQINVTVTSSATGQPLAGAKVELGYPDRRMKLTANDGTAALPGLLPEHYTMTIRAAGHARALREIDLQGSADTTSLAMALAPGGALHGTVTGENQQPLSEANIVFRSSESLVGYYGESPYADAQGRFRNLHLPLNTPITVSASLKDYLSQQREVTLTTPNQELELNFQLQRRPVGGSVAGVVTGADGQPIAGALVANFGNNPDDRRETKTDPLGRFSLHDLVKNFAGHELIVRAPGFVSARQRVEPAVGENPTAVAIKLERGHSIRVRVQNIEGQPVPGAYIDVNGGGYLGQTGESLRTDVRGEFTSNSLPLGSTFRVHCAGYTPIDKKTLALDGEQTVVLTLEPAGVIRGRVTDAATATPIQQFRVRIGFSQDARPGDARGSYRSEMGNPGLTFQAPGGEFAINELTSRMPFKVIVEAEGYEQLTLPRVVAEPEATVAAVNAALKKREPINPAELSGQVVDHKGIPVGGVQLRLIASASPSVGDNDNRFNWALIDSGQMGEKDYVEQYLSAVTGDDGKFVLKELLPGKFLQLAYWGPSAPKGRTLALAKTKPGDSQSVTIRLPEPAAIRGTFDGEALANASGMSLTLQGQPFHRYELVLADGKSDFAFENLPPGKYWLSVVGQPQRHADNPQMFSYRPIASRQLTVEAGKTLEVRFTKDDQVQGANR